MSKFLDLLASRPWLLADGATGTNYFQMGLQSGDAPEFWNVDHPDRVRSLHRQFIEAGADLILTNSFGGNRYRLKLHDAQNRVHELNKRAAELAREEANAAGRVVLVAGSMGPTGEIFEPVGPLSIADGADAFAEQARALAEGGADVLWIETISSEEELKAAMEGASQAGLPIVTTMSFDTNGRTMMGITPAAFGAMTAALDKQPAGIGANCGTGAAELVATVLGITAARPDAVVVAKGNCGIPQFVGGHIHYSGTPEIMADYACLALDAGARIIGGCCGTEPKHLAAMRSALEAHKKGDRPSVEEITAKLGEVSALAHGAAPARSEASERRRRRAPS
ncbi:5-methyltetrahydrofolate--homocysteine methyltransferase [Rhodoligotrophos appendicifer]|uniref:betaine--homocysteine S-methyltransferase n=1 Tax=Rhodoligotrophos appendicifer TaxID=987056 RepID=UPI001185CB32|nr:betaine--homocysteine S-methyltransferase [Rhodoligotrophos appendicifer]